MQTLTVSRDQRGVARVTMARPQVMNAFDDVMVSELDAAFAELGADDGVRVIVLTGDGAAFSAGADLAWMKRASEASLQWNRKDARRLADMLWRVDTCPKPTIARVNGLALGGGVGLTCACDIAVASESASFAVSEARFGILPATIGPYVINAIGKRQARRLALTARRISAADALQLGLVNEVVAAQALDKAVEDQLVALLANGPRAQQEIKTLFARIAVGPITGEVRELTAQTISRVRGTEEAREGFAAFLGKRPANWTVGVEA
jgi:methylglutaconyl-CoA hydratase